MALRHDFDEAEKGLTPTALDIANDQPTARAKAAIAKGVADVWMKRMLDVLCVELEA